MSVKWGSKRGASGESAFRVGIEISIPTPGRLDTQVTVTTKIWVWTKDKFEDPSTTLVWSGTAVDAGSATANVKTVTNSNWSKKNRQLLKTITKVVPTSYQAQSMTASVSLTGIEEAGGSTVATAKVATTLPESPVDPPNAPTGCAVARNSDTSHTVTWTNVSATSAARPYVGLYVERWDNVTNAWAVIKAVKAISSFTDTSTVGDRRYQYRVRAYNGGGKSAYATSGTIETTPALPANLTASRPAISVLVSWTNKSTIATSIQVWHSVNGVMDGSPLATLSSAASSYTHVSASVTATHVYYVKTVSSTRTSALSGPSRAVVSAKSPNMPTGLAPSGTRLDVASDIELSWSHSPGDGTTQTAFKVKWRPQGTSVWTLPTGQVLDATASAGTDEITCSGHGLNEGDIVRFAGSPPAPLAAGLQYWAIPVTETRFKVATTEDNAEDGIYVNFTTAGSGFDVVNGVTVSNSESYVIDGGTLDAPKAYEWMVRTTGRYSGTNPSGPWSKSAGFRTATKPTTTIGFPEDGDGIDAPQAMVAWTFYTPDPGVRQAWARASLFQGNSIIPLEVYESAGQWYNITFETDLVNGATYRAEVVTEGSNGVRSDVESVSFSTDFVEPLAPGVSLEWDDEDGTVLITIGNPEDDDAPTAERNAIYRSEGGSAWALVASNVPTDTAVTDYLPRPGIVNTYKIIASTPNKTVKTTQVAIDCPNYGDWYWLNGGPAWSRSAKVRYGAGVNISMALDKALHNFAGRDLPVEFTGTAKAHTIELTALLPRDAEGYATSADLLALAGIGGPVYYRDPVGRKIKCSLGQIELNDSNDLIEFRTTLTEVDA